VFDLAIANAENKKAAAEIIKNDPASTPEEVTQAEADINDADEAISTAETDKAKVLKETIKKYDDGLCYYTVYPNADNSYNVLRNDYYSITITKIASIGDTVPGPETDEDGEDIIGVNTKIEVSVLVKPWSFYSENAELHPW
ncbi:MAG: fimbria major subunit, partial [Bacteroides sp.]